MSISRFSFDKQIGRARGLLGKLSPGGEEVPNESLVLVGAGRAKRLPDVPSDLL
jgi:hypothetical protein